MPNCFRPSRLPLPLSGGVIIPPGELVTITARPQTPKFYPERLLIKEAVYWKINAIRIMGRVLVQDLPGALFAPKVHGRFPGCGEIEIPSGGELIVEMTYIGPFETRIPVEACMFGLGEQTPWPAVPKLLPEQRGKLTTARSKCAIPPNTSVKLSTAPMQRSTWPSQLVIRKAADWIVNDVCVGAVSIFAQSGDVPGSMFSEDVDSAICLGHLATGDRLSVVATYVGTASDVEFVYDLYGTCKESEAVDLPIAAILPISSEIPILSTRSAQITARCQPPNNRRRGIGPRQGFAAERIVLEGAADWSLNDIKIGRNSQFAQSGDVPGEAFSPGTLGGAVSFDVARAEIDVAIVTTYIGHSEVGNAFICGILGRIVDLDKGHDENQVP